MEQHMGFKHLQLCMKHEMKKEKTLIDHRNVCFVSGSKKILTNLQQQKMCNVNKKKEE